MGRLSGSVIEHWPVYRPAGQSIGSANDYQKYGFTPVGREGSEGRGVLPDSPTGVTQMRPNGTQSRTTTADDDELPAGK